MIKIYSNGIVKHCFIIGETFIISSISIHPSGTIMYRKGIFLHRDDDLPAVITAGGCKRWYIDGVPKRTGPGQTVVWPNKKTNYYENGIPGSTNKNPTLEDIRREIRRISTPEK